MLFTIEVKNMSFYSQKKIIGHPDIYTKNQKNGLEVWKEGQERVFDSNTRCFRLPSRRLRLIRFSLSFVKCTISIVSARLSIGTPTRLSISLGHSVRRDERDFLYSVKNGFTALPQTNELKKKFKK